MKKDTRITPQIFKARLQKVKTNIESLKGDRITEQQLYELEVLVTGMVKAYKALKKEFVKLHR